MIGATISTRIGTGHNEPTYTSTIVSDVVATNTNGSYVIDAYCRNCSSWNGGSLDLLADSQPFIFAFGPTRKDSDGQSQTATISRHSMYGSFVMNMTQANTAPEPVPSLDEDGIYSNSGAHLTGSITQDHDWGCIIHAVVMCVAFALLYPIGALLLRACESVKLHGRVQTLATILVVVGAGSGVYISLEYNVVSI